MSEEQKKIYHTIMCEAWELLKPNLDKVYYEELTQEVHKLSLKYENTPQFRFASDVVCAVLEEINRQHNIYGDQKK